MTTDTQAPGFWLAIILLVILAVIGGYELYALFQLPGDQTVTYFIRAWSQQIPLLPLAIGIVLGHLFFPVRIHPDK